MKVLANLSLPSEGLIEKRSFQRVLKLPDNIDKNPPSYFVVIKLWWSKLTVPLIPVKYWRNFLCIQNDNDRNSRCQWFQWNIEDNHSRGLLDYTILYYTILYYTIMKTQSGEKSNKCKQNYDDWNSLCHWFQWNIEDNHSMGLPVSCITLGSPMNRL